MTQFVDSHENAYQFPDDKTSKSNKNHTILDAPFSLFYDNNVCTELYIDLPDKDYKIHCHSAEKLILLPC